MEKAKNTHLEDGQITNKNSYIYIVYIKYFFMLLFSEDLVFYLFMRAPEVYKLCKMV